MNDEMKCGLHGARRGRRNHVHEAGAMVAASQGMRQDRVDRSSAGGERLDVLEA
jgi:hypothetical protein